VSKWTWQARKLNKNILIYNLHLDNGGKAPYPEDDITNATVSIVGITSSFFCVCLLCVCVGLVLFGGKGGGVMK
jgi:hypothetical protein